MLGVLSPLRTTASGAQTITVVLHPESLGDVRATVTATGNDILVRLTASTDEGAAALRSALPELRSGLSDTGQRPVVVLTDGRGTNTSQGNGGTSDGSPASSGDQRSARNGPGSTAHGAPGRGDLHGSRPVPSLQARLLDIRL